VSISSENVKQYIGKTLFDDDGNKIGKIGTIFLDDASGRPEWVTVSTGLFGTNESFVPAAGASVRDDGLSVPYSKDLVKDAPNVEVDQGRLSTDEEANLYRYYGVENSDTIPSGSADSANPADAVNPVPADREGLPGAARTDEAGPAGVELPADGPSETEESNVGRTDLVQHDDDFDDSDATGMSAGPDNRRGTPIGDDRTGSEERVDADEDVNRR
jgi:PRC-barrel domain protein